MGNESFGAIVIGFWMAKLHCSIALTEKGLFSLLFYLLLTPYSLVLCFQKERLAQVRKQVSRDEHEKRHLGNYR